MVFWHFSRSRSIAHLCAALMIGSSAIALGGPIALAQSPQPNPNRPTQPDPRPMLPAATRSRILAVAARDLGRSPRSLAVREVSRATWSDGCLGLGGPAELCLQAQVPGWAIEVGDRNGWGPPSWFYRADHTGSVIRRAPEQRSLSPEVEQRLISKAAQLLKVPARSLGITALVRQTWDGCMGISGGQMQPCTAIAIDGWRAILANETQSFVFHLDRTATNVRYNALASEGAMRIEPIRGDVAVPAIGTRFVVTTSGGIAGQTSQLSLMDDGRLFRRVNGGPAQLLGRLSPDRLTAWEQALVGSGLWDLANLNYLPNSGAADYYTVTLRNQAMTVQYADLGRDRLPPALQRAIRAWEMAIGSLPDR